jgi:hypothetical protein
VINNGTENDHAYRQKNIGFWVNSLLHSFLHRAFKKKTATPFVGAAVAGRIIKFSIIFQGFVL